MNDLTPHKPKTRLMLWSDTILDLQDTILSLGLEDALYIIGGAVRDAFYHLPVKDLDLATPGDAIAIARKLANAFDGDIFVMDDERNVARVLLDTDEGHMIIDVAAFRGDDLLADITGRDFTINSMGVDLLGDLQLLIDPLDGETDATQRVVRRCSPVAIEDDPIRALRAVRQGTQLRLRIEPETIRDIRQHGPAMVETSPERIRDEFFKILGLDRSPMAIKVLHELGFLQIIVPVIETLEDKTLPAPHTFQGWKQAIETVESTVRVVNTISYRRTDSTAASFGYGMLAMQLDRFRAKLNERLDTTYPDGRTHRALLVLAAIIHRVDDAVIAAKQLADDLRLSNLEKKRLMAMVSHFEATQHLDHEDPLALHRFWYPIGDQGIDAVLLGLGDYLATYGNEFNQDDWLIQVERALMTLVAFYVDHDKVVEPPPFINGNDLMNAFDLDGGRIIGDLLTALREAQVVGDVQSKDDAMAFVAQFLAQQS